MTEDQDDFNPVIWAETAVGARDGSGEKRPRGLLSHDDRLFVAGMKEFEWQQSESNARRRVIERIANGFLDFNLLRWLSQPEGEDVLEELGEDDLHRAVASLITFVYQASGRDADALSSIIESGVLHGENTELGKGPAKPNSMHPHSGGASSVDVSIQIDRNPDVNRIYEQYQENGGGSLTPKEIGVLVREGRLDAKDLDNLSAGLGLSGPPDPGDAPVLPSDALPDDENED